MRPNENVLGVNIWSKWNILAHWSTEKVFIRVYPCQLTIASATLQKGNPEILRLMNKYTDEFRSINKKVDIARKQWQELDFLTSLFSTSIFSILTIYLCKLWLGEIPWFRHFVWLRQPADADCVISIEYFWKLLNHVSKNGKSLREKKYTNNLSFLFQL